MLLRWLTAFFICTLCTYTAFAQDVDTTSLEAPGSSEESSADEAEATLLSPSLADRAVDVPDLSADGLVDIYVIPITEAIHKPNLFILRRGLKEAIANDVDMVLLDMDTPGGRVDYTIEMMEMLAKFEGITATFVNVDAISAGSFIAAATQEIYFAPQGKIGASAVIQGGGQDVPETARMKVESYLRANIRVLTEDFPYRSDVIRAMLDADFELKIGDELIKPEGELLTLTAKEAMREYGDPAQPLLGQGIYDSVDDLLDARFGSGNYEIRDFHLSYSEAIAKWMNTFAPALLGIGLLALFLEFKTPGFGLFGIGGIALLVVFFVSQYVAGLAGNEVIVFFAVGVLLVALEVLFFPGMLFLALPGLALIFGSLLWAMVDVWPGEAFELSPDSLVEPLFNLALGVILAVFGAAVFSKFFAGSIVERKLVLGAAAGGDSETIRSERAINLPRAGAVGNALTDLFPSGRVEIDGKRYDARAALGTIERGSVIHVLRSGDFGLIVESGDTPAASSQSEEALP